MSIEYVRFMLWSLEVTLICSRYWEFLRVWATLALANQYLGEELRVDVVVDPRELARGG